MSPETSDTQLVGEALARCRALVAAVVDEIPDGAPSLAGVLPALRRLAEELEAAGHPEELAAAASDSTSTVLNSAFDAALSAGAARVEPSLAASDAVVDGERAMVFPPAVFEISEVLQFLSATRKTGRIRILCPDETIVAEISEGRIVNAFSTQNPEGQRLGEILVAQGAIDPIRLLKIVIRYRRDRVRLGEALEQGQHIPRAALLRALRQQIVNLFHRAISEPRARVEFHARSRRREEGDVSLDLGVILLEGVVANDRSHAD